MLKGNLIDKRAHPERAPGRLAAWVPVTVPFCLLCAFYFAVGVTNRSEAMDSLFFAADAEVAPFWTNHDARMMLYYLVNRTVVRASAGLGFDLDVYTVLGLLGSAFAAGSVILLYRVLNSAYRLTAISSAAGAATLGFSYGFMRYANEAEVYIGAIFLTLVCLSWLFHVLAKPSLTPSQATLLGVIGGIAVTYYQPVALALFFAGAILFIARGYIFQYLAYGAAGVLTYVSLLVLALWAERGHEPAVADLGALLLSRSDEFDPPPFGLTTFLKAAMAGLHDVFSTTSLYAVSALEHVFRAHIVTYFQVDDLFFAANNYPLGGAAIATFCLALGWFSYLCVSALRQRRWPELDSHIVFAFAWLLLASLVNIILNPGEKEVWIIALVPVTILISACIYSPLAAKPWRLGVMVAILLAHNLIGGLLIFRNDAGDRYGLKTAWLRQNSAKGDWLLSTTEMNNWYNLKILRYPFSGQTNVNASAPFLNFMYYNGIDAAVQRWPASRDLRIDPSKILQALKQTKSRVFVFESVLDPVPVPAVYKAVQFEKLVAFGNMLKPYATVVADGPVGKTFEIDMGRLP